MLQYDYHLHTNYSPDGSQTLDELVKTAISKGLKEICITDHVDNEFISTYNVPDFKKFLGELEEVRNKNKEITIKFGCELSLAPSLKKEAKEIFNSYDFDFVIGSSHECCGKFLYTGTDFYRGVEKKEAFTKYFLEVLDNIKTIDAFSVYGHLDYIYRYSKYNDNSMNYCDYSDIIDEILKTLISKNKGIEINTSGFRYGLNNIHPNIDILKRYKELGGEVITVGSDSHYSRSIYEGFDFAYEALKEAGFKYITTFDKLEPKFVKID